MSDHYIPPPPTYELSQQGHDQKIPDQLQASFVVPKTPIGKVNEEDDEYGQDHVDNTSASKELQYQAAFFQPLQIKKRSPSGNGAQRSSRPLPPNPAEAHAYNRQVNSSPHGHHYLPEKAQSHNAYHYGAPPFSAGSPYTHNSVPISPISNSAHAPFDAPPNFHGGSRPFKPNQRSEQASSFYPRASQFGFQNALSSSTRNPPTRVNFDPSVAYANSLSQHSAHSNEHRAVDPAALYSSAVSSHLHPSSATTNSQYPYPSAS
ncbi:hypothetical protein BJ138DRAFT_1144060 [Hygrophoropsis aurantiaca]|uniref:Uncharacterized protein n=1 Tax=Hygrophoropsis aurantiaca TaxID=72124 RepID=A0ACB8ALB9_9AGAM|nr:hypothetical protein BJ138DRAFT_1144060 [Hygrophoropsis aurantiaca]